MLSPLQHIGALRERLQAEPLPQLEQQNVRAYSYLTVIALTIKQHQISEVRTEDTSFAAKNFIPSQALGPMHCEQI